MKAIQILFYRQKKRYFHLNGLRFLNGSLFIQNVMIDFCSQLELIILQMQKKKKQHVRFH